MSHDIETREAQIYNMIERLLASDNNVRKQAESELQLVIKEGLPDLLSTLLRLIYVTLSDQVYLTLILVGQRHGYHIN